MKNILDQLADEELPEVPSELDANLHHQINNLLFGQQVLELIFCGIPYVFFYLLHAITAAAYFSLSGRYPKTGEDPCNPKQRKP
jgi:hypothetical protein